jgi:hypothetical protein
MTLMTTRSGCMECWEWNGFSERPTLVEFATMSGQTVRRNKGAPGEDRLFVSLCDVRRRRYTFYQR